MKILGISGKKQSGKDTLADFIVAYYPGRIAKVAFATALKREVSRATGISIQTIEENKDNFRLILQGWGTDFRRKMFGNDYWLSKMAATLETMEAHGCELAIIPDVRFVNEFQFVKNLGGKVVRVNREQYTNEALKIVKVQDNHPSETELDTCKDFYFVIQNTTIEHLLNQAKELVTKL